MTIRAYTRISVQSEESQSIDQQRHKIAQWADFKHAGERIVWYADEGVSGSVPLHKREHGAELLADLTKGDVLAVLKIDRVARDTFDLLRTVKHCADVGAAFASVVEEIDTNTIHGEFALTLLGAVATMERRIIKERVLAARKQLAREGRLAAGRPPFGFMKASNPAGNGWVVRPDPEQGPRLRAALLAVVDGASQRQTAKALGLPEATFRNLLSNSRLYGKDPADGGRVDPDAALLSFTEWQALQATLRGPRVWTRTESYAPALRCHVCDGRLYLDASNGVMKCESRHAGRPVVSRAKADAFVESTFLERFGDRPRLRIERRASGDNRAEKLAAVDVELDLVGKRITQPGADVAALAATIGELNAQRSQIESEPVQSLVRLVRTGQSIGQWFATASLAERIDAVQRAMTITVHAAGREGGRFVVTEHEDSEGLAADLAE